MILTPEEFKLHMTAICQSGDIEAEHVDADWLMCDLLTQLGYGEGVEIFLDSERWYA